jgi:hypothetical protein
MDEHFIRLILILVLLYVYVYLILNSDLESILDDEL